MKALCIGETNQGIRELCAGARTLAEEVVLCVAGIPAVTGVADKCVHIDVPANALVDDAYESVNAIFDQENPNIVLAEGTARVLSLVGRLAAHVGTSAIVGASNIDASKADTLYFGGTGVRSVQAEGQVPIYVVAAGQFDAEGATGTDVVEECAFQAPAVAAVKQGEEPLPKSDVNLSVAEIVIGCGSGFSEQADLQLARDLASKVGGECGCTRPLAEGVQWFPKEAYIGVTGQMLSPRVYVGVGVSGQMQHMIGCNTANVVVAINKDKNAPIFRQCDLGIVADLKDVLPALNAAL